MSNTTLNRCAHCQFEQASFYSFCGHCGQSMRRQCGHCQQSLPSYFQYCGYCGSGLNSQTYAPAPVSNNAAPAPSPGLPNSSAPPKPSPPEKPAAPAPPPGSTGVEPVLKSSPPSQSAPYIERTQASERTPPEVPVAQSAVARVSERRTVAVLFCDIHGFTAMSEKLDPEEVSNIIQPLFQKCTAAINKYEGVVEKFIGDAIMALFGVPYAHEDDPERAALAALELRDIIRSYGKELQETHGFSINLRIGLNLGTVVAGSVEALEGKNYQVMGDAINTAARMEQNATPGHILVTEDMYKALLHSFELIKAQEIQAKGKKEPLQAYELLGVRTLQQGRRGLFEERALWVGRDQELAQLYRLSIEHLHKKHNACFLISGSSGIGKTRFTWELGQRLKVQYPHLYLLKGNSTTYSQNFSYFMLQSLIRSFLKVDETMSHTEVHREIQEFVKAIKMPNASMVANILEYTLYPHLELPQLKFITPERLQQQIFKTIGNVLAQLAKTSPLFIQIDDLQWCDPLSLQWLQEFHKQNADQSLPILFCITARANETEKTPPYFQLLKWQHQQELAPLDALTCRQLICKILALSPEAPLSGELEKLIEAILNRAAGNPYYIEEVLKNLLEDDLLQRQADDWVLACPLRDLPLPSSVQRLIMSRFDRLSPQYRQLLQTISAVGSTAPLQLLKVLIEGPAPENLQEDIQALVDLGFIYTENGKMGPECSFHQALTQEVIYNTMVKRRKRLLHRKIGEALEALSASDPYQMLDLLAYHFSRTEEKLKAVRYLYLTAEQAARLYANEQALEHYQYILELLGELEPQTLIGIDLHNKEWLKANQLQRDVIQKKAEILLLTGAYELALETVEQALKQTGTPVLEQARLMYCQGRVLEKRSEFEEARKVYETARALLDEQPAHSREQAKLWNAIGWVSRWMGEYEAARQACEAALKLLDQHPDMEQIAYAHNVLGIVHYYQHNWEKSLTHFKQGLTIQKQIQDLWGHANSLSNMGLVYFMTNRWAEAVVVFKQSLQLREQLGDQEGIATSHNNLGHAYLELEKFGEAETHTEQAWKLFARLGHNLGSAVAQCNLGVVHIHKQAWDRALELLNPGIESLETQSMEALLPEFYNYRIEVYFSLEDLKQVHRYLKASSKAIKTHADPIQKGRFERLWGHYYLRKVQFEKAKAHLEQALELLQPTDHHGECLALYQDLVKLHQAMGSEDLSYWEAACHDLEVAMLQIRKAQDESKIA